MSFRPVGTQAVPNGIAVEMRFTLLLPLSPSQSREGKFRVSLLLKTLNKAAQAVRPKPQRSLLEVNVNFQGLELLFVKGGEFVLFLLRAEAGFVDRFDGIAQGVTAAELVDDAGKSRADLWLR